MPDSAKVALRNTMRQLRSKVSQDYIGLASKQICARIETMELYTKANHIALYYAVNNEIDLTLLWHKALEENKQCYFPVLNEKQSLDFLPATPSTPFKKNRFGILEPDIELKEAISPSNLDLVMVPLVAFDVRCTRLGMGAGYYDRTFEGHTSCLYGVAYQFQRTDFIEPNSWDVPLNAVITQRALYLRNV